MVSYSGFSKTEDTIYAADSETVPIPGTTRETFESAIEHGVKKYYTGTAQSVIQTHASEDDPLIVLAQRSPRRNCELGYLTSRNISEIDTKPRVEMEIPKENHSLPQSALVIRLTRILKEDYFLNVDIGFGSITGNLPLLVTRQKEPVTIFLDPDSTGVAPMLSLYRDDYSSFAPVVKDFTRATIFPRIKHLVPSSTRAGGEAFLNHLRMNREWFEYEAEDRGDLEEILKELGVGRLTAAQAVRHLTATRRSIFEVSGAGTQPLSSVVPELGNEADDDEDVDPFAARPPIDRREETTYARILTSEKPIDGYRCFLSLSGTVQSEDGEFFLQPHATEIVWGGRKVLFIFPHLSKRFALYYDVSLPRISWPQFGWWPANHLDDPHSRSYLYSDP